MLISLIFLSTVIAFSKEENSFSKVLNTTSGPVRGQAVSIPENKTVNQYLGIPYAKAERFGFPRQTNWEEVFTADKHGKACPQASSSFGVQHLGETSEDCLNLNIFTPELKEKKLPVIVYIGGVFYSFGKANTTLFNGLTVAAQGNVVLVSLNYRLGIFGFLSTGSGVIKGNYGLADQIEALNWLQRNIQRFGGDPDDVTLVGHWSGAMSVGLLLVSPKAHGLFKHVVMMSGSPLSLTATLDHVTAAQRTRKIGEHLKCTNHSYLKECLKSKPVSDIILAQQLVENLPILSPFAPVVDGDILPDAPEKLYKITNQIKARSVMIGVVEDDGAIFLSPSLPGVNNDVGSVNRGINQSTLHRVIKTNKLTRTSTITSLISYKYSNWDDPRDEIQNKQQLTDLYSDSSFNSPAVKLAKLISDQKISTYFYHIKKSAFDTSLLPRIPVEGSVAYGNDLRLLLDSTLINGSMRSGKEGGIRDIAFRMLMDFVKTGNPTSASNPTLLKWPTYTPNDQYITIERSNITVQSKFLSDRVAFWNDLLPSMTSQPLTNTAIPTIVTTTRNHDDGKDCLPKKDKASKALTAVVAVMAIVIVVMLAILVYQARMLSKRQDSTASQQEH